MKFGVSTFITDEGLPPTALAQALEERGFDSLFVAEHTHMPVNGPTPPDGDLPVRDYHRQHDHPAHCDARKIEPPQPLHRVHGAWTF